MFDKRAVVFTGLAAEADYKRIKKDDDYESTFSWYRSPYMASFRAGRFDFILLTVHIKAGKRVRDRIPELQHLAEWVDERRNSEHVFDKDIIVMGDFNITTRRSATFEAITSKGLKIPNVLLGHHGMNLSRTYDYDQILHYNSLDRNFNDKGGIAHFYTGGWRKLFLKRKYPKMTKKKFTFQISDHLPLWIQVNIWTDDLELDQKLNKKKRERF